MRLGLVRLHQMEKEIQKIKIEGELWLWLMKPTEKLERRKVEDIIGGNNFITINRSWLGLVAIQAHFVQ